MMRAVVDAVIRLVHRVARLSSLDFFPPLPSQLQIENNLAVVFRVEESETLLVEVVMVVLGSCATHEESCDISFYLSLVGTTTLVLVLVLAKIVLLLLTLLHLLPLLHLLRQMFLELLLELSSNIEEA